MADLYLYILDTNHLSELSNLGLKLSRVEPHLDSGMFISLEDCDNKQEKINLFWKKFPDDHEYFLEEICE